jgi:hypothetical protein
MPVALMPGGVSNLRRRVETLPWSKMVGTELAHERGEAS